MSCALLLCVGGLLSLLATMEKSNDDNNNDESKGKWWNKVVHNCPGFDVASVLQSLKRKHGNVIRRGKYLLFVCLTQESSSDDGDHVDVKNNKAIVHDQDDNECHQGEEEHDKHHDGMDQQG